MTRVTENTASSQSSRTELHAAMKPTDQTTITDQLSHLKTQSVLERHFPKERTTLIQKLQNGFPIVPWTKQTALLKIREY
jgi:hypothetical protein